MMCPLSPMNNKIVVQRDEADEKTPGGIVLPDTAKQKPRKGTVLAVGLGKLLDTGLRAKPLVDASDVVYFGAYAGVEIEHEGKKYLVLSEDEVLAVVS